MKEIPSRLASGRIETGTASGIGVAKVAARSVRKEKDMKVFMLVWKLVGRGEVY